MPDPAFVFKGVASPFFEGCHNLAIAGCVAANDVLGDALRPRVTRCFGVRWTASRVRARLDQFGPYQEATRAPMRDRGLFV